MKGVFCVVDQLKVYTFFKKKKKKWNCQTEKAPNTKDNMGNKEI